MTRSDKGENRFDYKPKWIIITILCMLPVFLGIWYAFPREVSTIKWHAPAVEYVPTYIEKEVKEYIVVPCEDGTKGAQ